MDIRATLYENRLMCSVVIVGHAESRETSSNHIVKTIPVSFVPVLIYIVLLQLLLASYYVYVKLLLNKYGTARF